MREPCNYSTKYSDYISILFEPLFMDANFMIFVSKLNDIWKLSDILDTILVLLTNEMISIWALCGLSDTWMKF